MALIVCLVKKTLNTERPKLAMFEIPFQVLVLLVSILHNSCLRGTWLTFGKTYLTFPKSLSAF